MKSPTPDQTPVYSEPAKDSKESKWNETLSTIGVILLAPLVAIFLINFVFQSYDVEGQSMEQTLQDNDRLIVTKTGKTWARITNSDYIPKRYEIIVFKHSSELGGEAASNKQLVKRVIGLPGDRVVVKNGVVVVFNAEHPNGYLIDREGPEKDTVGNTSAGTAGGMIDETVKKGEVYVMGDNRDNSLDSRDFGTVRADDIIGRVSLRIFPFEKFDTF